MATLIQTRRKWDEIHQYRSETILSVSGSRIDEGRYKNASEVIRAGLRLLEERENKMQALKNAIQEGIDSGINEDFDADEFLKNSKHERMDLENRIGE